ncbi:MAG: type III toxin-antitoxin system TenpIN family toxin [Alphaproteobacteria bacterium]
MKFRFLTQQFYDDFKHCDQILIKEKRPYTFVLLDIGNVLVAIPLRSNITHKFGMTTPNTTGGLDFSKSVIITDSKKYIEARTSPVVRKEDFNFLKGKEYFLKQRLETFIETYKKKAFQKNSSLSQMCSLQYFHKELGIGTIPEETEE